MTKPTETQLKILKNAAGRTPPFTPRNKSQSGGWSGAVAKCYREGLLKPPFQLTEAGEAVLRDHSGRRVSS